MNIAHITPGTGGVFYCQNCFRDYELLKSLIARGHEVCKVPMYLPLYLDRFELNVDTPVFYGAINVYLKGAFPRYSKSPRWIQKMFDNELFLRIAAHLSGSTRAAGMEEMTMSMLRGEEGRQATELEELVRFLRDTIKPDIVHLSNALLLGLAKRIREETGAKVICSLQDENEWVDPMDASYRDKVWNLMAEKGKDVDHFIAASTFYRDKVKDILRIPAGKLSVIYGGLELEPYEDSPLPLDPPVLGYLCRLSENLGLGIVVDAFIHLKKELGFSDMELYLTGGYTGEDKPFIRAQLKKLKKAGVQHSAVIFENFHREQRVAFLRHLTLLSVPVIAGEAFGAYQIEALAAGVPIVQPNVGCYPEFIKATGGGVIYEQNDGVHLAEAAAALLSDPEKLRALGAAGKKAVREKFTMQNMAEGIEGVYHKVLKG
ncbi:glycosyltransferase family 4 protein [bacterium]|nr:glycosyltransferase family 4 protein [bacterium]